MTTETLPKERTEEDDVFAALVEGFAELGEKQNRDTDDFCIWYMSVIVDLQARRAKIDEMYQKMCRELEAQHKALQYRCGAEFRQRVQTDVANQKGKKRSINYLMGTAGFRMGKETIEFTDIEAAKKWLLDDSGCDFPTLFAAIRGITQTAAVVSQLWAKLSTDQFTEAITNLNKTPFMDKLRADGILPPGVELREATDNFFPWIKDQDALPITEPKPQIEGASE